MILRHFGIKVSDDFILNKESLCSEDVDLFFEDYSNTFDVDMSSYNYYDYFNEDVLPFSLVVKFFQPKKQCLNLSSLLEYTYTHIWGVKRIKTKDSLE